MFNRFILGSLFIFCSGIALTGCGEDTNGTLTIAVPTAVTAGKQFQATATFTSTKGVQNLPISFSTSDSTIISSDTKNTNSAGVATVLLTTANIINADKTVIITARTGDLTSSTAVTVRANKLIFNAPAKASVTGVSGSSIEYFITGTGSLLKYTDADNIPLGGKVITLKVNTLIGVSDIIWHWGLTDISYFAANPMSFTTLSDGSLPNSIVSLVGSSPASGSSSDFGANFLISVADPLFGTMVVPGDISFTIATP